MYWGYKQHMPRPTSKIGDRDHPWYENSGRHWAYIVGWGSVCVQIEVRIWRLAFGFTFWKSYRD